MKSRIISVSVTPDDRFLITYEVTPKVGTFKVRAEWYSYPPVPGDRWTPGVPAMSEPAGDVLIRTEAGDWKRLPDSIRDWMYQELPDPTATIAEMEF
jgi:hypothetical protein